MCVLRVWVLARTCASSVSGRSRVLCLYSDLDSRVLNLSQWKLIPVHLDHETGMMSTFFRSKVGCVTKCVCVFVFEFVGATIDID